MRLPRTRIKSKEQLLEEFRFKVGLFLSLTALFAVAWLVFKTTLAWPPWRSVWPATLLGLSLLYLLSARLAKTKGRRLQAGLLAFTALLSMVGGMTVSLDRLLFGPYIALSLLCVIILFRYLGNNRNRIRILRRLAGILLLSYYPVSIALIIENHSLRRYGSPVFFVVLFAYLFLVLFDLEQGYLQEQSDREEALVEAEQYLAANGEQTAYLLHSMKGMTQLLLMLPEDEIRQNRAKAFAELRETAVFLSRQDEPEENKPADFDPSLVLKELANLFARNPFGVKLTVKHAQSDLRLTGDSLEFRHAIQNLLINALQAAPGGNGAAQLSLDKTANNECRVRIRDNGQKTAAQSKEGSHGLGLRFAQRLARQKGGSLTIKREDDQTLATLTIPLQDSHELPANQDKKGGIGKSKTT